MLIEGHRLTVFDNKELMRIFGPEREEVPGGWRKLHNKEFPNCYSSPNITRLVKRRRL
jgi:hypothetical protein